MPKIDELWANACKGTMFLDEHEPIKRAWKKCKRGDWMIEFAKNLGISLKELTLAKGLIAQTITHLIEKDTSKKAVDMAIAFGEGKASREELEQAVYSAQFDDDHADRAAFWAANTSSVDFVAAEVAYAAAYDGIFNRSRRNFRYYYATVSADAAAIAVACGADADAIEDNFVALAVVAYKASLKKSADICRRVLTKTLFAKIAEMRSQE